MHEPDYNSFAENCTDALIALQEKFQEQYDVDWYDRWFYNQTTGLLTFSTDDVELNFRYLDVGSFSEKSSTWKWSWDNDTTLKNVKQPIDTVKAFGEKANYLKLTTGYFKSDEFEAWELAAISAKLVGGIGIYRPVTDAGLQIFFVVTEFLDNETAKDIKDKYVECSTHACNRIAFVCQHLNHQNKVGFNEAFESSENMELLKDDDFQAWCDDCEIVRQQEGEWNERSMEYVAIKLVCEQCYFEIKEVNLGYR